MAGEPRTLTDGLNEERKEGRTIEDDPRFWGGGEDGAALYEGGVGGRV